MNRKLKTELFENDGLTIIMCPRFFFSSTNPKSPVIVVAFFNFFGVAWTESTGCVFRVNPPFLNFFTVYFCFMFNSRLSAEAVKEKSTLSRVPMWSSRKKT